MKGIQNMATSIADAMIANMGETVTFSRPAGTYNPSTGAVDEAPEGWIEKVWFTDYSLYGRTMGRGVIQGQDRKAIYPGTSSHTPQPGDEIERSDGSTWRVEAADLDPSKAFYNLQVRPR